MLAMNGLHVPEAMLQESWIRSRLAEHAVFSVYDVGSRLGEEAEWLNGAGGGDDYVRTLERITDIHAEALLLVIVCTQAMGTIETLRREARPKPNGKNGKGRGKGKK
jgi:hypothetical protein